MKIYLLETFDKDKTVEINPPLSEKGIRMSRLFSLTIKNLQIDNCYTDTSVASFGTALLLVGTKVKINKNQKLNNNDKGQIRKFIEDLANEYSMDNKLLIIAKKSVLLLIKEYTNNADFIV